MGCGSSAPVDPEAILVSNLGAAATQPPASEKGAELLPGVVRGGSMTVAASMTLNRDHWNNSVMQPGEAIKLTGEGPLATLEKVSGGVLLKAADGSAAAFLNCAAIPFGWNGPGKPWVRSLLGGSTQQDIDALASWMESLMKVTAAGATIYCARPRKEGQEAAKTIAGTPMFAWAQVKLTKETLARMDMSSKGSNTFGPTVDWVRLGIYPAADGAGFEEKPSMVVWQTELSGSRPLKMTTEDKTQGLGVAVLRKKISDTWPRHEIAAAPGVDPMLLVLAAYEFGNYEEKKEAHNQGVEEALANDAKGVIAVGLVNRDFFEAGPEGRRKKTKPG